MKLQEGSFVPVREGAHLLDLQACEIVNIPNWFPYQWKTAEPDTILVSGVVCTAVYTRGKKKGRRNYAKRDRNTERTVAISGLDRLTWNEAWSKRTGLCHHCEGSGARAQGWHRETGSMYAMCKHCDGTGNRT